MLGRRPLLGRRRTGGDRGEMEQRNVEVVRLPREFTEMSYEEIMNLAKDQEHWKYPTKIVEVDTEFAARFVEEALIFYLGGAEMSKVRGGKYHVKSKGYYHYIGT